MKIPIGTKLKLQEQIYYVVGFEYGIPLPRLFLAHKIGEGTVKTIPLSEVKDSDIIELNEVEQDGN